LTKIQIDLSLALGWKKEDIMLVTNFDYEYQGFRSLMLDDWLYCDYIQQNTKTNVVVELFNSGLFTGDDLIWLHDLDVYQDAPIHEEELGLEDFDLGLTDYGRMPKLNLGSVFFNERARDIFDSLQWVAQEDKVIDEVALENLLNENPGLDNRIKKVNISYNFQPFNISSTYKMAIKPIRAFHFHPDVTVRQMGVNTLDYFIRGKNKLNKVLLSDRLVKLFNKYGYK
jgi:hypothetical protein